MAVGFDSKMVTARAHVSFYRYSRACGMEIAEPSISCFEANRISSSAQKEAASVLRGLGFDHD
jgi:hypothetical protein